MPETKNDSLVCRKRGTVYKEFCPALRLLPVIEAKYFELKFCRTVKNPCPDEESIHAFHCGWHTCVKHMISTTIA